MTGWEAVTEKAWQQQVVQLAQMLGFRHVYHTFDSRRSQPGWPDLVIVRDRLIALELKRESGKLSDAQRDWLTAIIVAGVEAYVVRPSQFEQLVECLALRNPDREPLAFATGAELGLTVEAA